MSQAHLNPVFTPARVASLIRPGMRVEQFRFRAGVELPAHEHEEAIAVLQLRGGFSGSVRRESYELGAGGAALLPAAARHTERIGPHVSDAILLRLGDRELTTARGPRCYRSPQVRAAARRIERELLLPDAASPLIVEGLVLRLLGLFKNAPDATRPGDRRWLDDAIGILDSEGLQRELGLTELASRVGVNRSYLARCLRQRLSMPAGAYLRARRLERAEKLLRESDQQISWIAHECGFYDHAHFTNLFRRTHGCPPSVYRTAQ